MPRCRRCRAKGAKGARAKGASKQKPLSKSDVDSIITQLNDLEKARKNGQLKLPDGDTLEVTNLHKIFWPKIKKTKGDLLRHYARVAPYILPVVDERPLVMKRLPNGVEGPSFYQHRAPEPVPPGVRIETLPIDDVPARLIGGSLKTLLYMAQLASISMDPFFSKVDSLDDADQVAIDLDPQPGATFSQILDVARWVQEELDRRQGPGLPEDVGLRGPARLHPAAAGHAVHRGHAVLPDHRDDGRGEASEGGDRRADRAPPQGRHGVRGLPAEHPGQDAGVRLQRARVSAFAGVSTPLTWKEVHGSPKPQDFTIDTIEARVKKAGDLWAKHAQAQGRRPARRDREASEVKLSRERRHY